ncbi:MAG: hypothetical protein KGI47_06285 [Betaproteobacteria bacterium]|nr:hypothetical protein [Betaproteobacteria bacterium]MDE2621915.1 hypothetical protein [Betaproteobacteria bacterium]
MNTNSGRLSLEPNHSPPTAEESAAYATETIFRFIAMLKAGMTHMGIDDEYLAPMTLDRIIHQLRTGKADSKLQCFIADFIERNIDHPDISREILGLSPRTPGRQNVRHKREHQAIYAYVTAHESGCDELDCLERAYKALYPKSGSEGEPVSKETKKTNMDRLKNLLVKAGARQQRKRGRPKARP